MSRGFGSTYGTGASDVVSTGVTSSGSDKRSYSMWYLRNGNGGGGFGHLFVKNFSEELFWNPTGSVFFYARCNASGTQTARHAMASLGTTGASTGVWNHILLTHDQSSGALTPPTAYFNTTIQSSLVTNTSGTTASNSNAYLFGNDHVNTRVWDGLIAHVAIWDNVILDRAAAIALSAGTHPMSVAPANCVCYLPLDGIHNPETDFVMANGPASVTGALFGSLQPAAAPLYIARREWRPETPRIKTIRTRRTRRLLIA